MSARIQKAIHSTVQTQKLHEHETDIYLIVKHLKRRVCSNTHPNTLLNNIKTA